MSIKKRLAAFCVCVVTILAMTCTSFAAENGNGRVEEKGVVIETITDKDTYTSGDTAKFTIKVTNKNTYDVSNFEIAYTLPIAGNLKINSADLPKKIDLIKAGETKELTFSTEVVSDTEAPAGSVNIVVIIAIVAAVVVVAVVVIVILLKKKKKASALMLVGALLAGTLAAALTPAKEVSAEVKDSDFKRVSVHDPSIVKDEKTGTYYIFGSHKAYAKSKDLMSWQNFSMNISTDYKKLFGEIWEKYCSTPANSDLNGNLWAPDVIWNETMQKWCMYLSLNGNDWRSVIVLLTADNIEGPYDYVGGVMYSGFVGSEERIAISDVRKVLGDSASLSRYNTDPTNGSSAKVNAIDPSVLYDDEGNLWMTYGSWSAGIYQIKLDNATGLRDYNYTYELAAGKSDPYLGYKLAGGGYNSGEGPYILHAGKYYYLFLSIGNLEASGGYNMRIYRSESINGPYVDENGKTGILTSYQGNLGYVEDGQKTQVWKNTKKYTSPLGIKLMGAYKMYGVARTQVAQGHNSAFVDDDGKIYVIYHTRFAGSGEGHEVRVHQLFQTEDGWLAAAPYEYSGETLNNDIMAKDVTGTYDFLVHRQDLVYAAQAESNEGETYWTTTYKTITVNSEEVKLSMRATWKEAGAKVTDSKGVVYAMDVTLNEDGTITGDHKGKWELTTGANVKMTIDGVDYTGVFVEQANELTTRDATMTFTLVGGNQCAWGTKNPENN